MRMKAVDRREHILAASIQIAERVGYNRITRKQVARAAGVAEGTVSHAFGSIENYRRELVLYAIREGAVGVIAQAIAIRDINPARLSPAQYARVLELFNRQ